MKKVLALIIGIALISGCTTLQETKKEEKILIPTQGLGVTSFNLAVNEIAMDTYNYVLMTVRNNAEGAQAKGIKVSLQNVEPFTLYECGVEHTDPSEKRNYLCNQFYNDYNIPYKAHYVDRMRPNEELQFFWNIKAPSKQLLANMYYTHTIYYLLEYDYTSTTTQTIFLISQNEFLTRSQEGTLQITSQTSSSPGEIKLTSTTQQPVIYTENDPNGVSFTLSFQIQNTGEGIAKPGDEIVIAIKKPPLGPGGVTFTNPGDYGWKSYYELSDLFDERFPGFEYPELNNVKSDLMVRTLKSDQINQPYLITLPLKFDSTGVFEPQKILTFTVYISYTYQKEGSTLLSVYPIR